MALVKGANGVVFDAVDQIASGLVGGGHAVYVDAAGNPVDKPVSAPSPDDVAEAATDAAEKAAKGSKG